MGKPHRFNLTMTQDLRGELEAIADESGSSMSEVFRIALALLKVTHEAKREGKYVGVVADRDKLDREIVGIL